MKSFGWVMTARKIFCQFLEIQLLPFLHTKERKREKDFWCWLKFSLSFISSFRDIFIYFLLICTNVSPYLFVALNLLPLVISLFLFATSNLPSLLFVKCIFASFGLVCLNQIWQFSTTVSVSWYHYLLPMCLYNSFSTSPLA